MFDFPKDLYTDVRIENVERTEIIFNKTQLTDLKIRNYKCAFIRIFDGDRWYYSSTDKVDEIQKEIIKLSEFATPNNKIYNHPQIMKLQINIDKILLFENSNLMNISIDKKISLLKTYFPLLEDKENIIFWKAIYQDEKITKAFYSSKGSEIVFDNQKIGFLFRFDMSYNDKKFFEVFQKSDKIFNNLWNHKDEFNNLLIKSQKFLINAKPIKKGLYPIIFSPEVAGTFIHECFGHMSEADFLVDNKSIREDLKIGKKIAPDFLTVIDDGNIIQNGYTPYDDEGTKATKTYLIKNGVLTGRLHDSKTGTNFEEELTGNARALNYEFEPIIRMTNTYIEAGNLESNVLIKSVKEGILIESIRSGNSGDYFYIVPGRAYMIIEGKVLNPVYISHIRGNVFDTLKNIKGISNKLYHKFDIFENCVKISQGPLPVASEGPYIKIDKLEVY